jgi:lactate dehydrogenase-like 2-hydroxyacid dehydrogenase
MVIINVARGKLIDEEALLEGLQSGQIAAAALDVYQNRTARRQPAHRHAQCDTYTPFGCEYQGSAKAGGRGNGAAGCGCTARNGIS